MKLRIVLHPCCAMALALIALAPPTHAADGLSTPAPDAWWPRLQARIALQSASVSPLSSANLLVPGGPQQGPPRGAQSNVQGGAIFGDYVFATPSFGSFRASGGLMSGLQGGGLPLVSTGSIGSTGNTSASPRLGVSLNSGAALQSAPWMTGAETPGTVPYLGLGFSGGAWRDSLSISADVGMVAERAGGIGRAVFGNQAFDGAVREMRLSPVLQLGVRYTF